MKCSLLPSSRELRSFQLCPPRRPVRDAYALPRAPSIPGFMLASRRWFGRVCSVRIQLRFQRFAYTMVSTHQTGNPEAGKKVTAVDFRALDAEGKGVQGIQGQDGTNHRLSLWIGGVTADTDECIYGPMGDANLNGRFRLWLQSPSFSRRSISW